MGILDVSGFGVGSGGASWGTITPEPKPYDLSFIRHGFDVATERILEMRPEQRALLMSRRNDEESTHLPVYEKDVRTALGEQMDNYSLATIPLNSNTRGLIITRN